MKAKQAYIRPEIFRVELKPDQAVLSACSLATTALANGGMQWCRTNCKSHGNMNMSDSGARPS